LDEPEARPHQDHLPHHQSFRYRSWMSLRLALTGTIFLTIRASGIRAG
jgi:hypothetical protein